MSLVNAVHELIEVAVGRKNLSAQAADKLHEDIEAERIPDAPVKPQAAPESETAEA